MEPHDGSVETFTENVPRLPAPFLVVTEMVVDPLPSILTSDNAVTRLFPLPSCAALIVRTPLPPEIVNVAVPVWFVELLWLKVRVLGLIDAEH